MNVFVGVGKGTCEGGDEHASRQAGAVDDTHEQQLLENEKCK